MTETPGTQAYMPPEVMVANPHYDVGVDEFSFGALMIHVFTAEWPAPKLGQTRVDPSNPHTLIPITEVERRENLFCKIGPDHPLADLIRRCLSNNPSLRPHTPEIVQRLNDLAFHYPPSFKNRVEMLHRISMNEIEKRRLQQEVERKTAAIEQKEKEKGIFLHEKEASDLATKAQQLQLELAQKEMNLKQTENSRLTSQLRSSREEVVTLQQQVAQQKAMLIESTSTCDTHRTKITMLTSDLSSTTSVLEKKEGIIDRLNDQLTRTRKFLVSKPQVRKIKSHACSIVLTSSY